MQRPCDKCGKFYEAKRPSSRFCGVNCRVAFNTGPKEIVLPAAPDPVESVYAVTKAHLERVARVDSVAGSKALLLARSMEASGHTGPALAALSKEHTALMALALEGTQAAADPLDELKARRERRHSG